MCVCHQIEEYSKTIHFTEGKRRWEILKNSIRTSILLMQLKQGLHTAHAWCHGDYLNNQIRTWYQ